MPEIATILRNTRHDRQHARGEARRSSRRCSTTWPASPTPRTTSSSENGDNMIRLSERRPAPAAACFAKYAPEYPCLTRRHRRAPAAPGRGVPRLHAAHHPRDAAEPAARLRRRSDSPALRRDRGPNCLQPAEPAVLARPTRCRHQPNIERRRRRAAPARAPAGSRRHRLRRDRRRLRRQPPRSATCSSSLLGPALGVTRRRRARPRRRCWSARWPAGAEVSAAMKLLDKKTAGRRSQAGHLHRRHHARHRRCSWSRSATSRSPAARSTRPCSPTPPAWSRATTSGSPASRSAP